MKRMPITARSCAVALVALAGALGAGTAEAGKFSSAAGFCGWQGISQPFVQWNDGSPYFLLDGGSFEGDVSGWTMSGGASVGGPNEPFHAWGGDDSLSLGIPNGASATSAPVCVTVYSPALRLFEFNDGDPGRPLQVFVNFIGTDGKPHSAKLPDQKNAGTWAPSQPISFLGPFMNVLSKFGMTTVTFTFSNPYQKDHPGDWRIDDVAVDPLKSQ